MIKLFSVVILQYKQPEFWKEAAFSVLKQDYPRIEIIVSDDGTPVFLKRMHASF